MTVLWFVAMIAASLAAGAWVGFRAERAARRIRPDLSAYVLTVPLDRSDR